MEHIGAANGLIDVSGMMMASRISSLVRSTAPTCIRLRIGLWFDICHHWLVQQLQLASVSGSASGLTTPCSALNSTPGGSQHLSITGCKFRKQIVIVHVGEGNHVI